MINFDFTNEDIETLKKYRSQGYLAINQLLNSNSESDLNFLVIKTVMSIIFIQRML